MDSEVERITRETENLLRLEEDNLVSKIPPNADDAASMMTLLPEESKNTKTEANSCKLQEKAGQDGSESVEETDTDNQEAKEGVEETPVSTEDEESCVQVLAKYLLNVRNRETHSTFLQDAVVGPFLSLCLASNSDRVVIGVLKVLNVLVKNRENLLRLKELLHFTDALKAASENEAIHVSIRKKAAKFHELIKNAKTPLGKHLDSSNNVDKSADLTSSDCVKPLHSSREIHLHINHTLNKERRFVITRALVKIDGIISVAFNPEQRLCIIRARRARPEVFGLAVANLGFECSLVTKNEKKEIVRVLMEPQEATMKNDENSQAPFYFPEDDEEEPAGPNAVAIKGFNYKDEGESWWDSAKKLARKSLFW